MLQKISCFDISIIQPSGWSHFLEKQSYQGISSNSSKELLAGYNKHPLLAAREHDICTSQIGEESKASRSNHRDDDEILFIS